MLERRPLQTHVRAIGRYGSFPLPEKTAERSRLCDSTGSVRRHCPSRPSCIVDRHSNAAASFRAAREGLHCLLKMLNNLSLLPSVSDGTFTMNQQYTFARSGYLSSSLFLPTRLFISFDFASSQRKMPRRARNIPTPIGPDQNRTSHIFSISASPC